MDENRNQQRAGMPAQESTLWVSETLRNGAAGAATPTKEEKEEKVSAFWRIFGGTVLSIVALVVVTLFNQLHGSIGELRSEVGYLNKDLRKDLTHLNETQSELLKKDEFSTRMRSVWDAVKELRADNTGLIVLKERTAGLEQQHRVVADERKELARELGRLREAKAVEEDRKELLRELQHLRERLAAMEGRQPSGSMLKPAVHKD